MNPSNPNPYLDAQGRPVEPPPPPTTIPFAPAERTRIASTGRWMIAAGSLTVLLGLSVAVDAFTHWSVADAVRALVWIAVGVLTILPARAVDRLRHAGHDLEALDAVFKRLQLLYAVKAGCALLAIAVALTVWRFAVEASLR